MSRLLSVSLWVWVWVWVGKNDLHRRSKKLKLELFQPPMTRRDESEETNSKIVNIFVGFGWLGFEFCDRYISELYLFTVTF